jgi:glycosyltransferase involved in cell wall biosynthesis
MKKKIQISFIKVVARILIRLIFLFNSIVLIFSRFYLKLKNRNFPKNYSELIYAFGKTQAIFQRRVSAEQTFRLEKLLTLLIEYKLSGYRAWLAWDLNNSSSIFHKFTSYSKWRKVNFLSQSVTKSMIELSATFIFKEEVLFSLIIPTYKTNPKYLEACIDSVINQIFKQWELIIIDDGSDSLIIENILNRYKNFDSRIRVNFLKKNQGIVSATNIGLKQASGHYIGFLDHDDVLSRDALFLIANAIVLNPELDYIYTDEDKIDNKGNYYDPNFKGGFNALMMKFHNYTHHLSVYSSRILAKVGELDPEISGAQDFDLLLRAQEFLMKGNVCHIPYICYHWRAHSESTASSGRQKKYVLDAAKIAIKNSLKREGLNCDLALSKISKKYGWTLWQPQWNVGDVSGIVTILIPTRNKGELLFKCISAIKKTCRNIPKIIVIDDNSTELKTFEIFQILEKDINLNIEIIKSPFTEEKFNYARLINFGAKKITTKLFLQLNNDVEAISINWIDQMVGWMQFKDVGVVGAKLKYPNGNLQHAGVVIGPNGGLADHQFHGQSGDLPGYTALPHISREVSAVTGACLMTDTELFHTLGGFDEINFGVEFNDIDYCLRARKLGKKIVYTAQAELTHVTSASRGSSYNPREHINFLERYRGYVDPYFSPNIDIDSMEMSFFRNQSIYKAFATKPRLIIFSHSLNRTGAPITAFEFALEMKIRGYEIEFITFEDGPLKTQLIDSQINFHNLNLSKQIYNISRQEIIDKINDIFSLISLDYARDIIICNTVLTFLGINIANNYGVKCIWHIHENTDYQDFVSLIGDPDLRVLAVQTLDMVDYVIFQAEATIQLYKKYFSREKILKISGGMPIDRIMEYKINNNQSLVRIKLGISEDCHVISIIGTTCDRKGQKEFLEALEQIDWKSIRNDIGEVTILVVGKVESDYSRALELQASKLYSLDIRIIDEVNNIYDYYFISNTFVCASKEESFPMVILLAMAFNVPIVSTLAGGIGEMLQNDNDATLTVSNSPEGVKEALLKSLKNRNRMIMADRSYEKILRFFDNKILYDMHENVILRCSPTTR